MDEEIFNASEDFTRWKTLHQQLAELLVRVSAKIATHSTQTVVEEMAKIDIITESLTKLLAKKGVSNEHLLCFCISYLNCFLEDNLPIDNTFIQ